MIYCVGSQCVCRLVTVSYEWSIHEYPSDPDDSIDTLYYVQVPPSLSLFSLRVIECHDIDVIVN